MRRYGFFLIVTLLTLASCGGNHRKSEPLATSLPRNAAKCTVSGKGDNMTIVADLLLPNTILRNAAIVFENQNDNGKILCVGSDCPTENSVVLSCPGYVLSPGLINAHDHIDCNENAPAPHAERDYKHRIDWRKGVKKADGTQYKKLHYRCNQSTQYAEARMLLSGTTSVAGNVGSPSLVRNLDDEMHAQLPYAGLVYQIFPLGDRDNSWIAKREQFFADQTIPDCSEYGRDTSYDSAKIYHIHLGEGVDSYTNNEFKCLEAQNKIGSKPLVIVHALGLNTVDILKLKNSQSSVVWSPRSNIDLYGRTAPVPLYKNAGVKIALGTDWTPSGSLNMLRELRCADRVNRDFFDNTLSDADLWHMATSNAADVLGYGQYIGRLETGKIADLTLFRADGNFDYRAVIDAGEDDVALVIKGGKIMNGYAEIIEKIMPDASKSCQNLDICGQNILTCYDADGITGGLRAILASTASRKENKEPYPLFFCSRIEDEPSCDIVPLSDGTVADFDRDGVPDDSDNCPGIFNPPSFDDKQSDYDQNGIGDACDQHPFGQ